MRATRTGVKVFHALKEGGLCGLDLLGVPLGLVELVQMSGVSTGRLDHAGEEVHERDRVALAVLVDVSL